MKPAPMLFALALAGCGALNDYQTASTLEPGHTELGVELSGFTVTDLNAVPGGVPSGAIVVRRGLDDGVELGLRLGTMGAEVTGKWRLKNDDDLKLAVAPTLSSAYAGNALWWAGIRAPLLIEVPLGAHALVFSPRVQAQAFGLPDLFGSASTQGFLLNAGAGVGLALRLGSVVLMPEIGLAWPALAVNDDGEVAVGRVGDDRAVLMVQAGVGLRYGWR